MYIFFFSSRRRHTRSLRDWSSDVCSSDLTNVYTSAKPSTRLRGFNHMTWEKLEENWSTSAGLLTDDYHLTLLNIYGAMNRQLFWAIAGIPADFNPMRELYILNPKKYVGRRAAPVVPTPDRPTR